MRQTDTASTGEPRPLGKRLTGWDWTDGDLAALAEDKPEADTRLPRYVVRPRRR